MKVVKLSLLVVLVAFTAGVAHADRKSDAEAKRLYEEGTKYYSIGEFPKAIENYKKAFELKPDPVLLYNIAQAYRLSNEFEQSLFFYKSFLRNMPTAPNRDEVEGRIKQVEAALAKQRAASAPPNGPVEPGTNPSATSTEPATTEPGTEPATTEPTPIKPPTATETAAVSAAGTENQRAPGPTPEPGAVDSGGKRPIYKKWWFWAGLGAVAVGAVVVVAASSGGGSSGPPGSHFGSTDVF